MSSNAANTTAGTTGANPAAAAPPAARKVDFGLGQVVMTRTVRDLMDDAKLDSGFVRACLAKHAQGEWGDVCAEDAQANESALETGARIFSVYRTADVGEDGKIWIITDAADDGGHRHATTILLPSDY